MSTQARAAPRTEIVRPFLSLERRQALVGMAFVFTAVAFFALGLVSHPVVWTVPYAEFVLPGSAPLPPILGDVSH